jgi:uncharacterized protein (TIGR03083 family)
MRDYAALYRESRGRIAALVREASDDQRARLVPGCPKWTVSDTVAHLAAVAVDALAGYSVPTISADEHTAVQVEQRRGRPLEEVLGEWDIAAGRIEQALAAQRMSPLLVHDVLTHEADIRGALGAGRPPETAWSVCLKMASSTVLSDRLGHLGRLTIIAGDHRFTAGTGEPATTLDVDPYELWRSLLGRRSRAQMAAWKWSGDPEPYVQAMPVLGPTEVPLSEPPAR